MENRCSKSEPKFFWLESRALRCESTGNSRAVVGSFRLALLPALGLRSVLGSGFGFVLVLGLVLVVGLVLVLVRSWVRVWVWP